MFAHLISWAVAFLAVMGALFLPKTVQNGELTYLEAAVLMPLVASSGLALAAFLDFLFRDGVPLMESHWGGLGGGLGGWRLSRALSTLILCIVLFVVTGWVAQRAFDDGAAAVLDRYQPLVRYLPASGLTVHSMRADGRKLYLRAEAPTQQAGDEAWRQIRLISPKFEDIDAQITIARRTAQSEGQPDGR